VKMFDAYRINMIALPCGEKNCDDMLSRFHPIPKRYGRTDRIAISISRVSVLTRDKKAIHNGGTTLKSKLPVVMEIMMKYCWGNFVLGHPVVNCVAQW